MKGIPLAWLQLTREKLRFFAALAGIAFAVVLMLTQLGFEDALLSTSDLIHTHLAADLILINPHYQFVISPKTFTERRLYQALGCDSVLDNEYAHWLHLQARRFDGNICGLHHCLSDPLQ